MLNNFKLLPFVSLLLCIWTLTGAQEIGLIKRANGNTGSSSPPRGHDYGHAYGQPGSPSHQYATGHGYEHDQHYAAQYDQHGPPVSKTDRFAHQAGRIHNNPGVAVARKGVVNTVKYISRPLTDKMDKSTRSNLRGAISNFGHSIAHASPSIEKFTSHFKNGAEERATQYTDKLDAQGFMSSDVMKGSGRSSPRHH